MGGRIPFRQARARVSGTVTTAPSIGETRRVAASAGAMDFHGARDGQTDRVKSREEDFGSPQRVEFATRSLAGLQSLRQFQQPAS